MVIEMGVKYKFTAEDLKVIQTAKAKNKHKRIDKRLTVLDKGFYVRTLCKDLGEKLGCPAHMRFLLRTQSGPFTLENAHTLEALAQAAQEGRLADLLLPPQAALQHLPMMDVPAGLEKPVINGGHLPWKRFKAVHETPAADGTPFGLWMNGALCAIAQRHEDQVKIRTWLAE